MRLIFMAAVRLYQRTWTRRTPVCPQHVSCSEYGYLAVRDHGFRTGIVMAAERIRSCQATAKPTTRD